MPHIKVVRYGTTTAADIYAKDIVLGPNYSTCTIWKQGQSEPLGSLYLTMPGKHNILNATAAVAVGIDVGIPFATIATALANFKGIDRRFTFKGTYKSAEVFDDYGHHPSEVKATLAAARTGGRRIVVLFQPHRYTRTKHLYDEFGRAFYDAEVLRLVDIYAG